MTFDYHLNPGDIIAGRYKITEFLGKGNFGKIYKAKDVDKFDESVAVKRLELDSIWKQFCNKNFLEIVTKKFKQEARTLQKLNDFRIPKLSAFIVQEIDTHKNDYYLVMEFIEGHTLHEELEQKGNLTQQEVIKLLKDILDILKIIHELHIVHGDIKPDNIILRQDTREIALIDFGSATVEVESDSDSGITTHIITTSHYTPPEQLAQKVYKSSDIYALGLVAIHALTNRNPSDLPRDPISSEFIWDYLVPDITDDFKKVLDKTIAQNHLNRYQSVDLVLRDLNSLSKIKPLSTKKRCCEAKSEPLTTGKASFETRIERSATNKIKKVDRLESDFTSLKQNYLGKDSLRKIENKSYFEKIIILGLINLIIGIIECLFLVKITMFAVI